MNWIAFVNDGQGNAQRVDIGHAWSSIEAAAVLLRGKPWLHSSDILAIIECRLWRLIGDGHPVYAADVVSVDLTTRLPED